MSEVPSISIEEALLRGDFEAQRRAVQALRENPTSAVLDALWIVHLRMQENPKQYFARGEGSSFFLYEESFGALRECARLNPSWIERTIADAADGDESIADLAYLIANLRDGGITWQHSKPLLFAKMPPTKARSLATNIAVYRDRAELEWALAHVTDTIDSTASRAFNAVVRIDPDLAVAQLDRLPMHDLILTRKWTFRPLLFKRPVSTRNAITKLIFAAPSLWPLAEVYEGIADELASDTIDLFLDRIGVEVQASVGKVPIGNQIHYGPLRLLASVVRPALVSRFRTHSSGSLEKSLVNYLCQIGPRKGLWQDNLEREPALVVLERIDGPGFLEVINSFLQADNQYGLLDAINLSVRQSNSDTRAMLSKITASTKLWDDRHPVLQGLATEVLAEIGDYAAVVESIRRWGLLTHIATHEILADAPAFGDELASEAIDKITHASSRNELPDAGAVMVVGLGKRKELAGNIIELLSKANPESDVALACLVAIRELRIESFEAVELVCRHLSIPDHSYAAKQALVAIGTPQSLNLLVGQLENTYDDFIVSSLLARAYSEIRFEEYLSRRLQNPDSPEFQETLDLLITTPSNTLVDRLLIQRPHVQEAIRQRIRNEPVGAWIVGSKVAAIRALALFDPAGAFETALASVRNVNEHDRELYPYLMVELDRERAVDLLLNAASVESNRPIHWAVGRALSHLDIRKKLIAMAASNQLLERLAACRLAIWQAPADDIRNAILSCFDDQDERRVAQAAVETFERWEKTEILNLLLDEFASANVLVKHRWSLLDAMISVGDPGDRNGPAPQWMEEASRHMSWYMRRYMLKQVEERQTKIQNDAEWEDRTKE